MFLQVASGLSEHPKDYLNPLVRLRSVIHERARCTLKGLEVVILAGAAGVTGQNWLDMSLRKVHLACYPSP
jgi:hypothetical protein